MKNETVPSKEVVRIFLMTDPHFLGNELYDEGTASASVRNLRDGKEVVYTDEIMMAFVDTALTEKPDAVIVAGDMTFNGEKASHLEFVQIFKPLSEAGIPVYVMPGNHDLRNPFSRAFLGDTVYHAATVETSDFEEIYADFGYKNADSRDSASLSYMKKLSDDVWMLALDTQKYEYNSMFGPASDSWIRDDTQTWMKGIFEDAKKAGATLIPITHQAALKYDRVNFEEFIIGNGSKLRAMMKEYHCPVVLSGHLHVQAIFSQDVEGTTLYDISTGAVSVPENLFGDITVIPGESLSYKARSVDVNSYAEKMGWTDPNLLDFHDYTIHHFEQETYEYFLENFLKFDDIDEEDAKALARLGALGNPYFYAGKSEEGRKALEESEDWEAYLRHQDHPLVQIFFSKSYENELPQREITISLQDGSILPD